MMKKFVSLLLMLTLLIAGCGKNESADSNSEDAKTLTLWSVETEDKEVVEKAVEEFNNTHADLKINAEFFDDESLKTKMKVAIAGNKLPDLFTYWSGDTFQTLVETGLVGDITEQINEDEELKSNVLPGGFESFSFNEKTYGIPLGISAVSLWYNKEIFEENGLTPPSTYTELLEVVDQLNENNITPITVAGKDRWPILHWYSYLAQRIGGTEPFEKAKNGEIDFTEESFVEAGEKLKELAVNKKGFVNGFLGLDYAAAEALFLNGRAAMYLQGEWALQAFVKNKEFAEKVGFVSFPTVEGGKGNKDIYHGGFGIGMAISANADQEAAFEALKFLTSAEQRMGIYETGDISPMKNVELDQSKMNPLVYEYSNYINNNVEGFFGYYDQNLDSKRADQFLNTSSAIVAKPDIDVKKELSKIVK
ncbi:sugar ABC transporter [Bacillus taeanensis]|uniref:Sugar ABC transporter n=2 Tax=Bacillus taeanensis TaxID=273032 RepID=A0A366Y023_9BACI|nr:sugar ABC transporter [Bacillus taeanensis]